jgi:predicted ATPase
MIDLQIELAALESMRGKYAFLFPSFITHIRFPRYKNMVAGARVDFSFPVTALVGVNGSGKTSVLNALYGAPNRYSTGEFWFSTKVDPIEEGEGSPNRFIYGHFNKGAKSVVETRKARVRKVRNGKDDPNYWEPTKEAPGDAMVVPVVAAAKKIEGRSLDRWNPVSRKVVYINFRKELSAFDKYFYFGKAPSERANAKDAKTRKIISKKDLIRRDAGHLAKVLEVGNTSLMLYKQKIATENRLLSKAELDAISFILGREYAEARLVRHRLFKGDGNLSVRFKTNFGQYSEAFAGSGEVAVTSCVVQVLAAKKGTLLLLDEPEVLLHPGAQERLLAFLIRCAKEMKIQVVFSTHSPHLIAALPDDAIKTFIPTTDGAFSIIQETHPYAEFSRLGVTINEKILILVEDRLAQSVINQSLQLVADEAMKSLFQVEYLSGGAAAILIHRMPVLMDGTRNVLILLDGDQRKGVIPKPDTIAVAQNSELENIIRNAVGVSPAFLIDGGVGGGNPVQRVEFQRKYLDWASKYLDYLPLSSPEEIILKAAAELTVDIAGDSLKCKNVLMALAEANKGSKVSSEEIDAFGAILLGQHRNDSDELKLIAEALKKFAHGVRPNAA